MLLEKDEQLKRGQEKVGSRFYSQDLVKRCPTVLEIYKLVVQTVNL